MFCKRWKQLVALTLSLALFLAVLPAQVVAYGASLGATALHTNPNGYLTDDNEQMAYRFANGTFDVEGVFDGKWKQVTYSRGGFFTFIANGDNAPKRLLTTGQAVQAPDLAGVTVQTELEHKNDGKVLEVRYIVKNSGTDSVTYSLGSSADVQIGDDDTAIISRFGGNKGFMMTSGDDNDKNSYGEAAQFNLFARASADSAVTDVDAFWYGRYGDWIDDRSGHTFYNESQSLDATDESFDSAAAYSWQDRTLAPGAEETHIVWIGIGGPGSEIEGLGGYVVEGDVFNNDGTPLAAATVQLCKYGVPTMDGNGKVIKSTTTDATGHFALTDVADGSYTVYITDSVTGKVITTSVIVSGGSVVMPDQKLSLGDIGTGTKVATGATDNLLDMFTPEMLALSEQPNTKVEVNLEIAPLTPTPADMELLKAKIGTDEVLFTCIDAKLIKVVTRNGIADAAEAIQPPSGQRLRMVLDLPKLAQGWYGYFVVRLHNGAAMRMPATLVADGAALEFEADAFSTYAIGYSTTQPVQSSSDGGSVSDTARLNEAIMQALPDAKKGDTISLSARYADYIAEYVMRELRAAKDVTLSITMPDGKVLVFRSGNLPAVEPGRIYWTLEELLKLYNHQSFINPDTGGVLAALLPDSIVR